MNKGVIFTIDALLALTIFVAAIVGIYRFTSPPEPIDIISVNFYAEADNFLSNTEFIFSDVTEYLLKNETEVSQEILENTTNLFQRNANMYFILLNETELNNSIYPRNYRERADLKVENHELNEFFIVRKYMVLTTYEIDDDLEEREKGNLSLSVNSSIPNRWVDIEGDFEYFEIYDSKFEEIFWLNETERFFVPEDAVIGGYYVVAINYTTNYVDWDYFNILRYGVAVMEVET